MASSLKHGLKPLSLIGDISKELRRATGKSPRTSLAFQHVMEQARYGCNLLVAVFSSILDSRNLDNGQVKNWAAQTVLVVSYHGHVTE